MRFFTEHTEQGMIVFCINKIFLNLLHTGSSLSTDELNEVNCNGKYSNLLRYGNNYCRNKFYSTGSSCFQTVSIVLPNVI